MIKKYIDRFVEQFENKIPRNELYLFCKYCNDRKLNPKSILNQTIVWLEKFNVNLYSLKFDDIVNYVEARENRIKRLRSEGKHQSVIDLSLYEIYAPTKEYAKDIWDALRNEKKEKVKDWNSIEENKGKTDHRSLQFFIKKYGEEEGTILYFENCIRLRNFTIRCNEYWMLRGYSEEESIKNVSERQKLFSLDICIEKYGEVNGFIIWKDRQERWQETLNNKPLEEKILIYKKKNVFSLEGYLLRGISEKDALEKIERVHNRRRKSYSKECINFIENFLISKDSFYGEREYFLYDKENKKYCFYDFTNIKKKLIFEYHGEVFHPNINILSENELENWIHPFTKQNWKYHYENDCYKRQLAKDKGFHFFEIYSNDPKELKLSIINQINEILS